MDEENCFPNEDMLILKKINIGLYECIDCSYTVATEWIHVVDTNRIVSWMKRLVYWMKTH